MPPHTVINDMAGKDATKKFDKHHARTILDSYRAKLQIGVVDNTISDTASIMSRSSRSSFSRGGKALLGISKFKFGLSKKKNSSSGSGSSDEAVVLMDDVVGPASAPPASAPADPIAVAVAPAGVMAGARDRRLSM